MTRAEGAQSEAGQERGLRLRLQQGMLLERAEHELALDKALSDLAQVTNPEP